MHNNKSCLKILLSFIGTIMLLLCLGGCGAEPDARDSVVLIETGILHDGGKWEPFIYGTGFFIGRTGEDPFTVVTSGQTADIAGEITSAADSDGKAEIRAYLRDGTFISANITVSDIQKNIAVLKLEEPAAQYVPLKIELPDAGVVGKTVRIVGFPVSSDAPASEDELIFTVREEVVRRIYTEAGNGVRHLLVSSGTAGEMPGAPVLNEKGNVIGICCGYYPPGEDNAGNIPLQESKKYFESIEVVKIMVDTNNIVNETEAAFPWLPVIIIVAAAIVAIFIILIVVRVIVKKKNPPRIQYSGAGPIPTASSDPSGDSGYRIECVGGALAGKKIMIKTTGALVIGSRPGMCSVVIPGNPAGVGSRHCEVWFNGSGVCIRDAGSPYGTVLSTSVRLAPNEMAVLNEGDGFTIGTEQQFVIRKKKGKII